MDSVAHLQDPGGGLAQTGGGEIVELTLRRKRAVAVRTGIVAIVAAGALVASALPASAHHPVLSGEPSCPTNETRRITWTIGNSEDDAGKDMTIQSISAVTGGGDTVSVVGYSSPLGPNETTTARSDLPGTFTGAVVLTVTGTWVTGQISTRSTTVTVMLTCGPPPSSTTTSTTTDTSSTTSTTTETSTTTTSTPEETTTSTTAAATTTSVTSGGGTTSSTSSPPVGPAGGPDTPVGPQGSVTPVTTRTTAAASPSASAGGNTLPFTGSGGTSLIIGVAALALGALVLSSIQRGRVAGRD
jgi:hypothetical protein